MSPCVVDASIFGPLFFDDEKDSIFDGLGALLAEGECLAPQHWRLELVNQIINGHRRKRMTAEMADAAIALIAGLEVAIDEETWRHHAETFALATKHGLTAYDAAYLELALRRRATLASYDGDLRKAARLESLEIQPQ